MIKKMFKMLFVVLYTISVQFSPIDPETESDNKGFSIIWISDTQDMAYSSYNHALQKMGSWIISMKEDLNIKYVVQTGDAVDNGASQWQWGNFDELYNQIQGKLPYISAAGNHEIKKNGYLEYCMRPDIRTIPRANSFMRGISTFCTFEANEYKFIILAIGFGMEEKSVPWVNRVLNEHRNYTAILLLHDYMQDNGRFSINGKSMYKQIVISNPNVRLVLCGHVLGVSSRTDSIDDDGDGEADRTVAQLMYNYQHYKTDCGQLRIMEFNTVDRSISITTFSPVTDRYYRDYMFGDKYTFTLKDAF